MRWGFGRRCREDAPMPALAAVCARRCRRWTPGRVGLPLTRGGRAGRPVAWCCVTPQVFN
jgi:hypothetical protein